MANDGNLSAHGEIVIDTARAEQNMDRLSDAATRLDRNLSRTGNSGPFSASGQRAAEQSARAQVQYFNQAAQQGVAYGQSLRDVDAQLQGIGSARFALQDLARTWTVVAGATLGASAAVEMFAINYERAFANVIRTGELAGSQVGEIRTQLEDMGTEVPAAFGDLTEIAALGGQVGIAAEGLVDFTNVVAKLEATTNLTGEAAGTALGRFQALLGVPSSEFENLASSILKVGINSVATESQIVNTATQISSMGAFAGLTADQVVGLSGALASVGAQPELARGTVTRTFTLMSKAIAEGGESLEGFARVSGVSADQFASTWGTDAFASTFQSFLQGLNTEGDAAVQTLNDLGLTSVRDVPLLLRLAGAGDVVTQAFADSASGYEENTMLNENFGIIAETTAERLKILANTIKTVLANIGNTEVVKVFVGVLQQVAEVLLAVARNPVGKFLGGIALAVAASIGVFAAYRAAVALSQAALAGMLGAQATLAQRSGVLAGGVRQLTSVMAQQIPVVRGASAAWTQYTVATAAGSSRLVAAGAAARTASTGLGMLSGALRGGLAGIAVTGALVGVGYAIDAISKSMRDAQAVAQDYFGDLSSLSSAIAADTANYNATGDAIRTVRVETESSSATLAGWAQQLETASGSQVALGDNTATTTKEITAQYVAIGEESKKALAGMLVNNEDFQNAWRENGKAVQDAGFDIAEFFSQGLGREGGASAYLDILITKYKDLQAEALETAVSMSGINQAASDSASVQANSYAQTVGALNSFREAATSVDGALSAQVNTAEIATGVNSALGIEVDDLSLSAENTAESLGTMTDALTEQVDAAFGIINSTAATQDALANLGASLRDNGNSFSAYSEGGRANIEALQSTVRALAVESGGDQAQFAANIAGLISELESYGVNAGAELGYLQSLLVQLGGTKATAVADVDTSSAEAKLRSLQSSLSIFSGAAMLPFVGDQFASKVDQTNKKIDALKKTVGGVTQPALELGAAAQNMGDGMARGFDKADKAARDSAKKQKDAAKDTKAELRSLVDYANDLSGAFNRSFEIRFGFEQSVDDSASAFDALAKLSEDAQKRIEDSFNAVGTAATKVADLRQKITELNATIKGLQADRSILNYQLGVAREYGDALRVEKILADLAKVNSDLSGAQKDRTGASNDLAGAEQSHTAALAELSRAQIDAKRTLDGTSVSAREQRTAVLNLVKSYQSQLTALANSGASTDVLKAKSDQLRAEFVRQLTQMGYNRDEVDRYAQAFEDLGTIIQNIPRNVTVTANTNPAQQAINEFLARNANQNINATISASGGGTYSAAGIAVGSGGISTPKINTNQIASAALVGASFIPGLGAIGGILNRFSGGGYTGSGGKYEPKGVVHGGEYVVPKQMVNQSTGLPYASALGQIMSGYAGGGHVASSGSAMPSTMMVELSPTDRALLAANGNVTLSIDGRVVANATNTANTASARRGTN